MRELLLQIFQVEVKPVRAHLRAIVASDHEGLLVSDSLVFDRLVQREDEISGLAGFSEIPASDFLRNHIDERQEKAPAALPMNPDVFEIELPELVRSVHLEVLAPALLEFPLLPLLLPEEKEIVFVAEPVNLLVVYVDPPLKSKIFGKCPGPTAVRELNRCPILPENRHNRTIRDPRTVPIDRKTWRRPSWALHYFGLPGEVDARSRYPRKAARTGDRETPEL